MDNCQRDNSVEPRFFCEKYKKRQFFQTFFKKGVDNVPKKRYNMQALAKRGYSIANRVEKYFEKISKKVLTKGKRCGIIVKLSARRAARSVIEN